MMLRAGMGSLRGTDDVKALIAATAAQYGVPASLALAVAKQESGYNQSARGAAGEIGVFQLMPGTAAGLGVDPYDLTANVRGGVTYLAQMIRRYNGDYTKAVEAYNAGPGNVDKGRIPTSTRSYTSNVLAMAGSMTVPGAVDYNAVYTSNPELPYPTGVPTGVPTGSGSGSSTGDGESGVYTLIPPPTEWEGSDTSGGGIDSGTVALIGAGALLLFALTQ